MKWIIYYKTLKLIDFLSCTIVKRVFHFNTKLEIWHKERSDTIKTFYLISLIFICLFAGALMAHYFGFGLLLGNIVLEYFGGGKEFMKYVLIFLSGSAVGIFVYKTSVK